MRTQRMSRRRAIGVSAGAVFAAAGATAHPARAATKVRLLTNWFAEGEHGGFYQAKATGLYEKAGLDVSIQMGGPQVNGMQLLLGGDADVIISYDIQVLGAVERGVPVVAIAAVNQFDLVGIMTHADVAALADLKGRKILAAQSSHTTYWPWLKQKFGFSDDQIAPYTFTLAPFLADPTLSQQGYLTSEPFEVGKHNVPVHFFLLAEAGYPPYSSTVVTTRRFHETNAPALAAFVRATMEGWRSYLRSPAPGNRLIKVDNPKMEDDQLAYTVRRFNEVKVVAGGDAAKLGMGIMTPERWKKTRDFLVAGAMLKPETEWTAAFTTDYVNNLRIFA